MTDLKIGDKVSWTTKHPRWDSMEIRFHNGVVLDVIGGYAEVMRDNNPKRRSAVPVDKLTRLDATALVQAVGALPLDDAQRESAISACRIADVVDDYVEAMARGDMSGVEL